MLSFSKKFTNVVRTLNKVYCFNDKMCFKVPDIYHKCNEYERNFLFEIEYNLYLQFVGAVGAIAGAVGAI